MKSYCFIVALFFIAPVAFAEETIHDKIKAAYFASGEVQQALEKLKSRDYEPGRLDTITLGGTCGAAGCDYNILVVQTMSQKKANPKAASVSALVQIKVPANVVTSVTLADIIPKSSKRKSKASRSKPGQLYFKQGVVPGED